MKGNDQEPIQSNSREKIKNFFLFIPFIFFLFNLFCFVNIKGAFVFK